MKRGLIFSAGAVSGVLAGLLGPQWFAGAPESGGVGVENVAELDDGGLHVEEEWLTAFGIEVDTAAAGELRSEVELPGEAEFNPDALAHVTPRVAGIVLEVLAGVGERVKAGSLLAVLESRELAETKAGYLASEERLKLAVANFERETRLRDRDLSTEKAYLESAQGHANAEIDLRLAKQRLYALGVGPEALVALMEAREERLTRYEVRAPFDGAIIEKHITQGERLDSDDTAFIIADLSTIWVDLTVYQKDLDRVRAGQEVLLHPNPSETEVLGAIDYVSPVVAESTRAASARVILTNDDATWRPGQFVSARVVLERTQVPLVIPNDAVVAVEGIPGVFVRMDDEFFFRRVALGRRDSRQFEVVQGLEQGELYVSRGAFVLKSELEKKGLDAGHGH